tara:strand:+ start:559 stop:786 length:228 start_codon:yes stop_codon:yes gene_type:complete
MLSATIDGDAYALETQTLRPLDTGLFPSAIVTHGLPRGSSGRRRITNNGYVPKAMEFTQRGHLTAIISRRGFGKS